MGWREDDMGEITYFTILPKNSLIILKACVYFTLYKYPHRNFNFCLSGHVGSRNDLSKWFYLWRTWNYIGLGEFKFSASRLSVLGSVSLEMAVVSHNSTGFCHRNRYITYGYPWLLSPWDILVVGMPKRLFIVLWDNLFIIINMRISKDTSYDNHKKIWIVKSFNAKVTDVLLQ